MKSKKSKSSAQAQVLRDFNLNDLRDVFPVSVPVYPQGLYSEMPNGKAWGDCTAADLIVLRKFYLEQMTIGELEDAGQLDHYWLRARTIRLEKLHSG